VDLRRAVHSTLRITALVAACVVVGPSVGAASPPDSVPPADTADTADSTDPGNFAVQPSGPNGPGGRDYFVYTLKVGEVYGDTVAISECRPLSRNKSWTLVRVIERALAE